MAGPAPFFTLSRLNPEPSYGGISNIEAVVGRAMLPLTARPAGTTLTARLVVRLATLPSGTATIRVRRDSLTGPILATLTTSTLLTLLAASTEFTPPAGAVPIFVTTQASDAVTGSISMFSVAFSGQGAPVLAAVSAAPDPVALEAEAALGVDFDMVDNFPMSFVLARGRKNLANAIARQLQTPEGFLAKAFGGDPDYGYDLRAQLNTAQRLEVIAGIEARVKEKVQRDERVRSADVTATYDLPSATLSVEIAIEDEQGPFTLVLNVSEVSTAVVLQPAE